MRKLGELHMDAPYEKFNRVTEFLPIRRRDAKLLAIDSLRFRIMVCFFIQDVLET